MIVDLEIAFAIDLQVKQSVLGEQFEHVFKKRHTDRDVCFPAAVEIEIDANIGFFRLAMDACRRALMVFVFISVRSTIDRFLPACRH